MTKPFRFDVGTTVLYKTHSRDHAGWLGIVTGREFYEDQDGSGNWYYIRWIDPDGKVNGDKMRLAEDELKGYNHEQA